MNIMLQYYHHTPVICFLTNYGMLNIYVQNINLLELSNHLMEMTLAQTHTNILCMCAFVCVCTLEEMVHLAINPSYFLNQDT